MNQARINRIRNHVKIADENEATASEHNWKASQLIWEEAESGTVQKEISRAIGKSEAHVSRMKKCWQLRVVDAGLEGFAFGDLGSFYDFYNSEQVRGESDSANNRRDRNGVGERDRSKPSGDYSAHGLAVSAYNAIDALRRNKAHHELLTEEDLDLIRQLPAMIRALLRDIG